MLCLRWMLTTRWFGYFLEETKSWMTPLLVAGVVKLPWAGSKLMQMYGEFWGISLIISAPCLGWQWPPVCCWRCHFLFAFDLNIGRAILMEQSRHLLGGFFSDAGMEKAAFFFDQNHSKKMANNGKHEPSDGRIEQPKMLLWPWKIWKSWESSDGNPDRQKWSFYRSALGLTWVSWNVEVF